MFYSFIVRNVTRLCQLPIKGQVNPRKEESSL